LLNGWLLDLPLGNAIQQNVNATKNGSFVQRTGNRKSHASDALARVFKELIHADETQERTSQEGTPQAS